MPAEKTHPDFVYRLVTPEEWFVAREAGIVPTRSIDQQDGYIHLSTRAQALETAQRHLSHEPQLLALEIPLSAIADQVKFELAPKRGEAFPHLYGVLRKDHVVRAIRIDRDGGVYSFGDVV